MSGQPVNDQGIDWQAERAAFELWYLGTQCANNRRRMVRYVETGLYVDRVVRIAWRAWRQGVERGCSRQ